MSCRDTFFCHCRTIAVTKSFCGSVKSTEKCTDDGVKMSHSGGDRKSVERRGIKTRSQEFAGILGEQACAIQCDIKA